MNIRNEDYLKRAKKFSYVLFLLVTIIFAAIFVWNEINYKREVKQIAIRSALDAFNKDILYRQWNSMHGGVYVPVTPYTKPNPYLDVPERDISTPSGKQLTLVNPAYMTRQVYEYSSKKYDIKVHLTSLDPIRPENSPDSWEKKSLERFNAGDTSAISFEYLNGEEHLRYMKPFVTTKGCLRCHAKQGYVEGDIRGGISLSVPMDPISDASFSHLLIVRTTLTVFWIAFTIGLVLLTRNYIKKEMDILINENKYSMYFEHSPEGIIISDKSGRCISVNTSICSISGFSNPELLSMCFYDLIVSKTLKNEIGLFNSSINQVQFLKKKDGSYCTVIFDITRISEDEIIVFIRDITEQVEYEKELNKALEWQEAIFEGSRDAVFISDYNAKFVAVNRAAVELTGYTREELLNMHIPDLHDISDLDAYLKYHKRIFAGEKILSEAKILTKDKRKVVTEFNNCKIIISDIAYMHTTAREITERKKAEKALRDSEVQFRNFFEKETNYCYMISPDGFILDANPAALKVLGYRKEDLIGKPLITTIYAPSSINLAEELFLRWKKTDKLENEELSIKTCSGEIRDILLNVSSIKDILGNLMHSISIQTDITDRKMAENAIRISEEKFRRLYEDLPTGSVIADLTGCIISVNKAFSEFTGYSEDELTGKPFVKFTHQEDKEIGLPEMKKLIIGEGDIFTVEKRYIRKDGATVWGSVSLRLLRDTNGIPLYFIPVIVDITKRREMEAALRQSEEKYRTLIETVNTGIFMSSIEGKFIHANSTVAEMAGYGSIEEFLAISPNDLYADPLDRKKMVNELQNSGFIKNMEILSLKKNGNTYWISVSAVLLKDSSGKPVSILGSVADINERKKIELELEKYRFHLEDLIKERTIELEKVNHLLQDEIIKQKESEIIVNSALLKEKELSELKSKFISITSHEFRTPLTTIISSAQLLGKYGRSWDEERYTKHTERIQKSVQYLTNLLNDVLTISKTESGKIKFEPRIINLKNLCLTIQDDISAQLTDKHRLNFEFRIPDEEFLIDEKLITFILFNLLSNAIKYSIDGGDVDFIVTRDGKEIIFTIQDNGIGIPEADQSNLFEPFNRGQNVGTISGTGLGMSIVKRSVEIHGGSISFESKEKAGTRFFIKIPTGIDM